MTGIAKAQRPRKVKTGRKWATYGQLPATVEHDIGAEEGALGASAADWDDTLPETKLARPKYSMVDWDADASDLKETVGWDADASDLKETTEVDTDVLSELKAWDYEVESCQPSQLQEPSGDTRDWDINLVPSLEHDEDHGEDLTALPVVRVNL